MEFGKYIQGLLKDLMPLRPQPTGVAKNIYSIKGIKAVLFDIYGTLLVSSSGDINSGYFTEKSILSSFKDSNIKILIQDKEFLAGRLIRLYKQTIDEFHHEFRRKGVPFPEIDILRVWNRVLRVLASEKLIQLDEDCDYARIALVFELTHNRVYPMPEIKDVLSQLERKNLLLGLVSNAQFYTPLILNYFLTGRVELSGEVEHFNSALSLFSYVFLRAKPDLFLFEKARDRLGLYGIKAKETLYIGNDKQKDIWTAQKVGFRTALFAGDRRSLRLRNDLPEVQRIKADFIITELKDVLEIIKNPLI